jgi:hypothetical protein
MSAHFHIHVDAMKLSSGFEKFLISNLGFWRSDFGGHPDGQPRYEPLHHLTQEPSDGPEFRRLFDQVLRQLEAGGQMDGYVEGEYVPLDIDIPEVPYDPTVPPPFRVELGPLPSGSFRESEVHVTLDRDTSDPRLTGVLTEMGLYSGYLPKAHGVAQVLTVQGSRNDIDAIKEPMLAYLRAAGGGRNASLKEERIVNWWTSGPDVILPPVIQRIDWR